MSDKPIVEPASAWLCLHCGMSTPSDCAHAIPCCKDQFAIRVGFLRRPKDGPR